MARPVGTTDDHLLDAAGAVLMGEGPAAFTLAKAAAAAGVSAATLVKRFGSKDRLLLRLSQRWAASLDDQLERSAAPHVSPLARLRAVAVSTYLDLDRPETACNQVAVLAVDLQDDEMRGWLHLGWQRIRTHLERHAADAVAVGELPAAPPPALLARIVQAAMEGGCIAWSLHPEGSLLDRLGEDLDALLGGWSARPPTTTR